MTFPAARILYAEDDEDMRDLVSLILTQKNCEVITAETHDQAQHLAETNPFDLYILDSWLPDAAGADLCRRLRESDSTTPILFYSGATLETDIKRALASGAQGYLTKPATPEELIAEVFRLLGRSQTGKD